MRPDPFDLGRVRYNHAPADPRATATPLPDFDAWHDEDTGAPPPEAPRPRRRWGRWIVRGFGGTIVLLVLAIAWLAITAPLSKSLQPPTPPSITLTAADGTPIARRGAIIGKPVDAATLPEHVTGAFLAIEDRRFRSHWGIDPRGIRARGLVEPRRGAGCGKAAARSRSNWRRTPSSIRTAATRKIREVMIAFWLEAWLTKDEILSRYLSNVYFGDNVYGIDAAAHHYFGRAPDDLNVGQAGDAGGAGQGTVAAGPDRQSGRARGHGRRWSSTPCRRPGTQRARGRRGRAAARSRRPAADRAQRHLFRGLGTARGARSSGRDQGRGKSSRRRSTAACSTPPNARSNAPACARRRSRWSR